MGESDFAGILGFPQLVHVANRELCTTPRPCPKCLFILGGHAGTASPRSGFGAIGETARRAGIATFATVLLAAIVLVTAAFRDDYSMAYIFHHSNRDLPAPYKFATLWSGQEGSLLFWSLLLGHLLAGFALAASCDPP